MVNPGRMIQLPTLSYNGVAAQEDRTVIPKVDVVRTIIDGKINIPAGTTVPEGTTFSDLIQYLYFGEGMVRPIYVEGNEIQDLCQFAKFGDMTGHVQEPELAVGDNLFSYVIEAPLTFKSMGIPEIVLKLQAAGNVISGITGLSAEVTVTLQLADKPLEYGAYFERAYRASAARHEIDIGPSYVKDIYIKNSTAARLKRVTLTGPNHEKIVDFDQPECLRANYCSHAEVTKTTAGAKYLIDDVNCPAFTERKLLIEQSTADTLFVLAKNYVA